jgi:copper ion binding protein
MQPTTDRVSLQAPDISCGHCVSSIENRLGGLEGVTSVSASAESKTVDVEFDTSKLNLEKIEAELADEGYPVTK